MKKEQFIKTRELVELILLNEPFARDCDLFLIWQYWNEIDPNLELLTIKEFKERFLTGRLGLPDSITRARRDIQKNNSELKSTIKNAQRLNRAEFWRQWFSEYKPKSISENLNIVKNFAEIEIKINDNYKGYYTVSQYLFNFDLIKEHINNITLIEAEALKISSKAPKGSYLHKIKSARELSALFVSVFKPEVIKEAICVLNTNNILKPPSYLSILLDLDLYEKIKAGIIEEIYIERYLAPKYNLQNIDINNLLIKIDNTENPGNEIIKKVKYITQGLGRQDWGAKQGLSYYVLGLDI